MTHCIEVATGRKVVVVSGTASSPPIVYRYIDDQHYYEATREDFFLNGYFVAAPKEPS